MIRQFFAEIIDLFDDPDDPDDLYNTDKIELLVQTNPQSDPIDNNDVCKMFKKDLFSHLELKVGKIISLQYVRSNDRLKLLITDASAEETELYKHRWEKCRENLFKDIDIKVLFDND